MIGGHSAPAASTILLDESDAFLVSNGRCAFRVSYDIGNAGSVATAPPFLNRTRASGDVVTTQTDLTLGPGETRNILTDAYIDAGTHKLVLSLDDDAQVAESDETNNELTVEVTVGGACG